jgi:hypothetical protein
MKPWQLIVLRLYMFTFGRMAFFAGLLRKVLVVWLVRFQSKTPYHASSNFFSLNDLGPDVDSPERRRGGIDT